MQAYIKFAAKTAQGETSRDLPKQINEHRRDFK